MVDTNVWVAAFNPKDSRHGEAAPGVRGLLEGKAGFQAVITDYIFDEVATLCLRAGKKAGHLDRATTYVEAVLGSSRMVWTSEQQFRTALEMFKLYKVDFTDCTVAKVMEDAGLREIWSFDADFDRFPHIARVQAP